MSVANIENGRQNVLLRHVYVLASALELDKVSDLLPTQPKIEALVASMLARRAPKVDLRQTSQRQRRSAGGCGRIRRQGAALN